jgi:hypothetical protein
LKLDEICKTPSDEFYTPEYAIYPILKYIPVEAKVWCPFDTEESNFVKLLKKRGNPVVHTHLSTGHDFFTTTVDCDVILSNPPYSRKGDVLERLYALGKPFAMLVGGVGIFESEQRFSLFEKNPFEILQFNKRIKYFKDYKDPKPSLNPPFSSVYICSRLLPEKMVLVRLSPNTPLLDNLPNEN